MISSVLTLKLRLSKDFLRKFYSNKNVSPINKIIFTNIVILEIKDSKPFVLMWNVPTLRLGKLAYHWRSCSDSRNLLSSETGKSSKTSSGAFGIVVLADGTSRGRGAASLSEDMIAASCVTLVGTGVRVRPGVVGTIKWLNVPRPMDNSHRFPYFAGRRRVIIVLLGLATSLVNDFTATGDSDFFLRHDRRFYT